MRYNITMYLTVIHLLEIEADSPRKAQDKAVDMARSLANDDAFYVGVTSTYVTNGTEAEETEAGNGSENISAF